MNCPIVAQVFLFLGGRGEVERADIVNAGKSHISDQIS
jgi:hypothetical protein